MDQSALSVPSGITTPMGHVIKLATFVRAGVTLMGPAPTATQDMIYGMGDAQSGILFAPSKLLGFASSVRIGTTWISIWSAKELVLSAKPTIPWQGLALTAMMDINYKKTAFVLPDKFIVNFFKLSILINTAQSVDML